MHWKKTALGLLLPPIFSWGGVGFAQGPGNAASGTARTWQRASDDYPLQALRDGMQGWVGMRLSVNPKGKLYRCEIKVSSGSSDLDEASCRVAREKSTFAPTRDDQGQAVFHTFTHFMQWINPNPGAKPARDVVRADIVLSVNHLPSGRAAAVNIKQVIDPDGHIRSCGNQGGEAKQELTDIACKYLAQSTPAPLTDEKGIPVKASVDTFIIFVADEAGAVPVHQP